MKKNIWLINYHAYPPGTSKWTRHFDLFKNLINEYVFTCFAGDFIHDTQEHLLKNNEKKREKVVNEIKYIILKSRGYNNIFSRYLCYILYFFQVLKLSKKIKEKPDIVLGSSPDLLMGLCAYILSKKYRSKFIFEIRDVWPETLIELNVITKKHPMYFIFRKLELFLYRKADAIIVLASGVKKYLEEKNINSEKIFYINNGVDIEKFELNLGKYKEKVFLPKDKFNIVYTGAISLNNGLDSFIKAAKIMERKENKEVFFNIFGKGTEEQKLIKQSENLKNIKFYGSVKKELIPSILTEADLLYFSFHDKELYKKYGISPNKLFEYLAAKKPILFSCDSYNDPVKESNCGISLKKSSPEKIVEAILEIKNVNGAEREKMGKRAYNYVCDNFEMKKLSKTLQESIEFCIQNGRVVK